ncbi:MAG: hypothetical protein ACO3JG_08345 [Luteolibacter sp.]
MARAAFTPWSANHHARLPDKPAPCFTGTSRASTAPAAASPSVPAPTISTTSGPERPVSGAFKAVMASGAPDTSQDRNIGAGRDSLSAGQDSNTPVQ